MREEFFSERGIYYRINDFRPDRQTMVFVHGLTGSSSAWLEYENKFEREYNILTFDLRGHGKSEKPKRYQDYEIRDFVQDIDELIKHLHIEKFTLISHSFGVVIALEYLIQNQAKIESTIFLSPIFNVKKVGWTQIVHVLLGWSARIMRWIPFSGNTGKHINYLKYQNTGDWNLRRMAADVPNTSFHVYVYCLDHIYRFDGEHYLDQISIPALIVHGKKDTLMPVKIVVEEIKKIRNYKLILLNNANHIIVINNIPEVSQAIEDFITSPELLNNPKGL